MTRVSSLRRFLRGCVAVPLALLAFGLERGHADPLAIFVHNIVGARLLAAPSTLYVPKNIPGALSVTIVAADGSPHPNAAALARGRHIEAVLRGPSFPAYRLLGLADEPLILPSIPLPGDYEIDDIRLVDTMTGEPKLLANPERVPVKVFPDVLVSQVTSRQLSFDEIQARGITIDASAFSAVEFEAAFMVEGRSFPVRFPVVTPKFKPSVEVLPASEVSARIARARAINEQALAGIEFPRGLALPNLNLKLAVIHLQPEGGEPDKAQVSIPAMVVIPGSIGFLDKFFSVQVFVANGSPSGSALTIHDVTAEIVLPAGRDLTPGTVDDPLVLARVDGVAHGTVPVQVVGGDGQAATGDDIGRLRPAETGVGELLVEGKKEGLHSFDIRLSAVLDGLASGEVQLSGTTAGSILVRNPKFSIVFAHPSAVRAGEPYSASVTVLNTSEASADLVSVHLAPASISGAHLATGQSDTVLLGSIPPGQSAIANFQLVAEETGAVAFSNLTGDDGLSGRFDLKMAVDARGVPLSTDVIRYPDEVSLLPEPIRATADRVLGQALAVATAGVLPAGVHRIEVGTVKRRILELAEAGQRVLYHDDLDRVLTDLLVDWNGARTESLGFDQILRETEAGSELETAILESLSPGLHAPGLAFIDARSVDLAGRTEPWGWFASSRPEVEVQVHLGGVATSPLLRAVPESGAAAGPDGQLAWLRDPAARTGDLELVAVLPAGQPSTTLAWLANDGSGAIQRRSFVVSGSASGVRCVHFRPYVVAGTADLDDGCTNASSGQVSTSLSSIAEASPEIVSVVQDLAPIVGRPNPFCYGPSFTRFGRTLGYGSYGTLLAVLFNKPMDPAIVERPDSFHLDVGSVSNGVKLEPGGRVALVNMRDGIATFRPHGLVAAATVVDARGHSLVSQNHDIELAASSGVSIAGRLVDVGGAPISGLPVTLTMNDLVATSLGCQGVDVRANQVITGADGRFRFDYVMSGIGYTLGATDIRGLDPEVQAILLEAAPTGALDPAEIELMTQSSEGLARLGRAFTNGLANGVAVAESVDRTTFHDVVPADSLRIGSEVPVVLRFRGRGLVHGTIVADDGTTPIEGAAVNLWPESNSRELGRGVLSDALGRFQFPGVPLGSYSIQVRTGDRRLASAVGRLSSPGESAEHTIQLANAVVERGAVEGLVYEADGTTPSPFAAVEVSTVLGIAATGSADANGHYAFGEIPVGIIRLAAVSFDGRRAGIRTGVTVSSGATVVADLRLPGTARVIGRVELPNGTPVANALVAGGEAIVRTGPDGSFVTEGVPVGQRLMSAGIEPDPSQGISFTRIGSAQVDVLPGASNVAIIRFPPAGRLQGRVFDAQGAPVPLVRVGVPVPGGFRWVNADGNGRYSFAPLTLGPYAVVAPTQPVTEPPSESDVRDAFAGGSADQIAEAMAQVFASIAGEPTGPLNTGAFGATRTDLISDGQTAVADIHYFPTGIVSGTVKNHLGVPIGADVALLGLKQGLTGGLDFGVRSSARSDPATGAFSFTGLPVGPYTVSASSPFYTAPATLSGQTTISSLDATGLVVTFPPTGSTGARLTGLVRRDGLPVGAGTQVNISLAADYQIQTRADGTFDTQIDLPARTYHVNVLDPSSGRVGSADVTIRAGVIGYVEIDLLSVSGAIDISVSAADGTAAAGATIQVDRNQAPARHATLTADGQGQATLPSAAEGQYSVRACKTTGQTQLCASALATVVGAAHTPVALRLIGSGTIQGTYVEADGHTPVAFAEVTIGKAALATTDAAGAFSATGIPIGRHTIVGHNAVTGRSAVATARITSAGQTVIVGLREAPLGSVAGRVIGSDGLSVVPAALVWLSPSNSTFSKQFATSDSGGRFNFPSVPPGSFILSAQHALDVHLSGSALGEMPFAATALTQDVYLEPRGSMLVRVSEANGSPALATVSVTGAALSGDTDSAGTLRFTDVPLATYTVHAHSRVSGRTQSLGVSSVQVAAAGVTATVAVQLLGVGTVTGHLTSSSGAAFSGGEITLELIPQGSTRVTDTLTTLSGSGGAFSFANVPVGEVRARAISGALAASANGVITSDGQSIDLPLTLSPSADVIGTLYRADGITRVVGVDVTATFVPPSGLLGAVRVRTGTTGMFRLNAIPAGSLTLRATVQEFDGVLYDVRTIAGSSTPVNLGSLVLDEAAPTITDVLPIDGATGVALNSSVRVTFSEVMDPTFDSATAAYLTDDAHQAVPATLAWESPGGPTTVLRITPTSNLASQTHYTIVVLGPSILGLHGIAAGPGPTDMAQRPMNAAYLAHFTTMDGTPPVIQSFTPLDLAEQVDPATPVRIEMSEAVDPASIQLELRDAQGSLVPSSVTAGLQNRVIVLAPSALLATNTTYQARLLGARDVAGNALVGTPLVHTFATVDTIGPTIANITAVGNPHLVEGASISYDATLTAPETNFQLQSTTDLVHLALSAVGSARFTVRLGAAGSGTVWVRAIDRFGNFGPWFQRNVTVDPNLPPDVAIAKLSPSGATLLTGHAYSVRADATDDSAVSALSLSASGAISAQQSVTGQTSVTISGTVPAAFGPGQSVTFSAAAQDNSGVSAQATPLVLAIGDGVAPSVQASITSGPVVAGTNMIVHVAASDAFGLASVSVNVTGAVTYQGSSNLSGTSNALDFTIPVPADAVGGAGLFISYSATDVSGLSTSPGFGGVINDVVPPTILLATPSNGATNVLPSVTPSATFSEAVNGISTSSFYLARNGTPVSASVTLTPDRRTATIYPASNLEPNATFTWVFTAGITDTSGNALAATQRTFTTADADVRGPHLTSVSPANGATGVSLAPQIQLHFDEALGPVGLTANDISLARASGGAAIPFTVDFIDGRQTVVVRVGSEDVTPGVTYRLTVGGQPQDAVGNLATDLSNNTWGTFTTDFTTSAVDVQIYLGTHLAQGRVVEGEAATAVATGTPNAIVSQAQWTLNGHVLGTSYTASPRWNLAIPTIANAGTTASLATRVTIPGFGVYDLAALGLSVEPASGDYDNDGIRNDLEVRFGTHPWVADATDDPDEDTLTNAQEIAKGTSPFLADTDHDGIRDDVDSVLDGVRPPGLFGVASSVDLCESSAFLPPSAVAPVGPFTLELWTGGGLCTSGPVWGDGSGPVSISCTQGSAGSPASFAVTLRHAGGAVTSTVGSLTNFFANQIAVTYDGENLNLYVNGRQHGPKQRPSGSLSALEPSLGLFGAPSSHVGWLQDVRLWSYARTAQQIGLWLHRAPTGEIPGLVAAWWFEPAASSGTVPDATGHGWDAQAPSPSLCSAIHLYSLWSWRDPVVLNGAGRVQLSPFGAYDLDGDSPQIYLDAVPAQGHLELANGTLVGTVGAIPAGAVYYVPTHDDFLGPDSVSIHAEDSLHVASLPLQYIIQVPSNTWTGASTTNPSDWTDAANWSAQHVPLSTEIAHIPADAPTHPQLGSSATVLGVYVDAGAELELSGASTTLTVAGNVLASGTVFGDGVVRMTGGAARLRGTVPELQVAGQVQLTGSTTVTQNLTVLAGGQLDVSASHLGVFNDFVGASRSLRMVDGAGVMDVYHTTRIVDSASYAGSDVLLSAGVLRAHGDFIIDGTAGSSSEGAFQASGTHRVEMLGANSVIRMDYASEDGTSHNFLQNLSILANVSIQQPTHPASPVVALAVNGTMIVGPGAQALAATSGVVLVAQDLLVGNSGQVVITGLTIEGTISVGTSGSVVAGSNATIASLGTIDGTISTGDFSLAGSAESIDYGHVSFSNLILTGATTLSANLSVPTNLTIQSPGVVVLNTQRLSVGGTLTSYPGGLSMQNSSDVTDVQGHISWVAGPGTSNLAAGTLVGHAGLSAESLSFNATGTHLTQLLGSGQLSLQTGASQNRIQNLQIGDGSTTSQITVLQPLTLAGSLSVAANGTLSATGLTVTAGSIGQLAGTTAVGTLVLNGTGTLSGDSSLTGALTIQNPGVAVLNGHRLTVSGNLTSRAGGLRMDDPSDVADIGGNIVWNLDGGTAGHLTAGTLIGRGAFTAANSSYSASGSHTTELIGAGMLTVPISGNRIQSLTLIGAHDTSGGAYTVNGDLQIGDGSTTSQLTIHGALTVGGSFSVAASGTFSAGSFGVTVGTLGTHAGTTTFGTLTVAGTGSTDFRYDSGHVSITNLTLGRPIVLSSSTLQVSSAITVNSGGSMSITGANSAGTQVGTDGSQTVAAGSVTINSGGSVSVGAAGSGSRVLRLSTSGILTANSALNMLSVNATVSVGGAATWAATSNFSTLSAGRLIAHGNLQISGANVFRASGTHTVEVVGTSNTLQMSSGGSGATANRFQDLRVTSTAATITTGPVYVAGEARIEGTSTANARLTINTGQNLTVAPGHALTVSSFGRLVHNGTFTGTCNPVGTPVGLCN